MPSNNGLCLVYTYTACAVCVTIFSTGSKFRPVSNFRELHTLTQATHSYALLIIQIAETLSSSAYSPSSISYRSLKHMSESNLGYICFSLGLRHIWKLPWLMDCITIRMLGTACKNWIRTKKLEAQILLTSMNIQAACRIEPTVRMTMPGTCQSFRSLMCVALMRCLSPRWYQKLSIEAKHSRNTNTPVSTTTMWISSV